MQTACWQFCFSDRFTGARNPARLPTTIQSRRIRCAPTFGSVWWVLHPHSTTGRDAGYNRSMRKRGRFLRAILAAGAAACGARRGFARAHDQDQHRGQDPGRPTRSTAPAWWSASSRDTPSSSSARPSAPPSNCAPTRKAKPTFPSIPQGKIRIQVIAKGYQTFGKIFDITEEEKTVDITLNPPQQQYSAH